MKKLFISDSSDYLNHTRDGAFKAVAELQMFDPPWKILF